MDDSWHKELIFIQEARLEDIRELKRYQWQSSYYAVLASGGLVALLHLAAHPSWMYRVMLVIGCALIFFSWKSINDAIEMALARSRQTRDSAYLLFDKKIQETRPTDIADRMSIHRTLRTVVFCAAIVAAAGIAAP